MTVDLDPSVPLTTGDNNDPDAQTPKLLISVDFGSTRYFNDKLKKLVIEISCTCKITQIKSHIYISNIPPKIFDSCIPTPFSNLEELLKVNFSPL